MNEGWGIASVLAGGVLNGSFIVPMKRMTRWGWENSWLVYAAAALLLLPWLVAWATIPHLGSVIRATSTGCLVTVLLFGAGWGIGSVLFGLGVSRLGLAVGYGVILGLIAPIGTFLPLVVLHPERLWTRQGYALVAGTVLVLIAITFLAVAARRREQESASFAPMVKSGFLVGLIICILSGIFSPMLNFSYVFGQELQSKAVLFGAPANLGANAIWCVTLTAGFVVNAAYCVFLLQTNRTWKLFGGAPVGYWLGGAVMGLMWFGSFIAYGMGATALGPLGGIVGWPLFMSMSLIASNALGALTGEWKGTSRRAYTYSLLGMVFLILAVIVISRG
jgi:L-rhamnose-H+ transport protein